MQLLIYTFSLGARPVSGPPPSPTLHSYPYGFSPCSFQFSYVSLLKFSCNLPLMGAHSAQGFVHLGVTRCLVWGVFRSTVSSPWPTARRHREPSPGDCQCSLKPDFNFFYFTIPTPIEPFFVAWEKNEIKGDKRPEGAEILQSQSQVIEATLSAQLCEARNHLFQNLQLRLGRDMVQNDNMGKEYACTEQ